MKYELKRYTEKIGSLTLELETLADLDQAIDKLCEGVDEKSAEAVFVEDLCPYFGVVWPAARALSLHMARMGSWLKDKKVLEIGCGLGLPSLVSAKLGAKVTATDFHPDVPIFLNRNLELNGLSIDYRHVDWKAENTGLGDDFDFVIGSDVLYESHHPEQLAKSLIKHCRKGTHIILADPGRSYLQRCVDLLNQAGFRHDVFITTVADLHSDRAGDSKSSPSGTKDVFVLAFQKN